MALVFTSGNISARGYGFSLRGRPAVVTINTTYQNTNNSRTGTIYTRSITQTGSYVFTIKGAAGTKTTGTSGGCSGRSIDVNCVLLSGQTIYMLPATQGPSGTDGGGGGGSFLLLGSGTSTPIAVAGGGGGMSSLFSSCDGTTQGQAVTSNGAGGTSDQLNTGNNGWSLGGVNGNGSTILASSPNNRIGDGAGGGLYTNGLTGFAAGGVAYANGGAASSGNGGFGGGGSGNNSGGGGAGGYSGGGGVWDTGNGGGGGSWVASVINGYSVIYTDNGAVVTGNGSIFIH
jgi:hypothetical protein